MKDLLDFYNNAVKDQKYVYLIMADKEKIDFDGLKELGKVEEVNLKQIFGY